MTTQSSGVLEVCIASLVDARAAVDGGADRLELNSAIELDGLTSSPGMVAVIKKEVDLPVFVMVRPRAGSFELWDHDKEVLLRDIEILLHAGADGIVMGFLDDGQYIDARSCRWIMERSPETEWVFHRAFDLVPDPIDALETLIDLGFSRVLTSGQQHTALLGAACIRRLIEVSKGRMDILAGGGIHPNNLGELLERTGLHQIHGTFSTPLPAPAPLPFFEGGRNKQTDPGLVAKARVILDSFHV